MTWGKDAHSRFPGHKGSEKPCPEDWRWMGLSSPVARLGQAGPRSGGLGTLTVTTHSELLTESYNTSCHTAGFHLFIQQTGFPTSQVRELRL
jgi:hypothetical protein